VNETQPRKQELRQEIEETRLRFHDLLARVPEGAFGRQSLNPAWTVGEVLYHMSLAPRFLISDVRMISGQGWMYKLVALLVPGGVFNWLNKVLTRYGARHLDRQFLADEYDRAHAITLNALEMVAEDDLDKEMQYPDWDPLLSGEVTLERLFHYVKLHFDAHKAQILAVLSIDEEG